MSGFTDAVVNNSITRITVFVGNSNKCIVIGDVTLPTIIVFCPEFGAALSGVELKGWLWPLTPIIGNDSVLHAKDLEH